VVNVSSLLYPSDDLPEPVPPSLSLHFANYTEMRALAPAWAWHVARCLTLVGTLALMALMLVQPQTGLPLFWGMVVPLVPLLLVVAPGVWRQVCPMAFLNQGPRTLGFSLNKTLPLPWQKGSYGIAVGLFIGAIALRDPLLNHSAVALSALLSTMLVLAFAGGVVFKGRSGWCGTFCPLGPIQRAYGHAPLTVVRNGYCPTCVGCQPHCYDFSPRAAIFKDLDPAHPRHAQMRQWFFGMLPGLILAFFMANGTSHQGWLRYEFLLAESALASLGLYALLGVVLPLSRYQLSLVFAVVALLAFYWFTGPNIVGHAGKLLHLHLPPALSTAARGLGLIAGGVLAYAGLRNELMHRQAERRRKAAEARRQSAWSKIHIHPVTVTNRATGKQTPAQPGQRLLDTLKQQGTLLPAGCGAGLCGGDAVAICEGIDKLAPPGEQERATLRRMGLEGRARLACMCEVTATVTVDTRREALQSAPAGDVTQVDVLAEQGIQRVVVIGNGVAGNTAAEALRRHSPSVQLTVISDETQPFYNRMALADMLPDPTRQAALNLRADNWAEDWHVSLQLNVRVERIDRNQRQVLLRNGQGIGYDRLILATGADAARPGPVFSGADNGFVLRTLADVEAIHQFVNRHQAQRVVVQGGGVLGVEAALALRQWGLSVQLIERAPRLMATQLDDAGSALLQQALANQDIAVITGVLDTQWVTAPEAAGQRLTAVRLDATDTLQADLFVACLGIRPRLALAEAAGLDVSPRGIVVDAHQRSSDPSILAVGDVAVTTGPAGLWPVAATQAERAVAGLLGEAPGADAPPVLLKLKTKLLDVYAWGESQARDGDEVWVAPQCTGADTHWRLIWRQGQVVGWSCIGQPGRGHIMEKAVQGGVQGGAQIDSMDAVRLALEAL
jgi:nitrite reductase (NADH) large subunit